MCVYPWDLQYDGVEAAIGTIRGLGCSGAVVNCSYHLGRFFHPRRRDGGMYQRLEAGVSFAPDTRLYPSGLIPEVDEEVVRAGVQPAAREACERLGLAYHAWLVGTHDVGQGPERLDLTVRNACGDRFRYALCPSHPEVRQYLRGLVEDTCRKLCPASVVMESPGFLGLVHGEHHETIMVALGETAEHLLSMCFCTACERRARDAGLDPDPIRARVVRMVQWLVERERGTLDPGFTSMELAALLVEFADLHAYIRFQQASVASLVGELRALANAGGARLSVLPSVFKRPSSRAWMEGISLTALPAVADAIFLVAYFPSTAQVLADLGWVRLMAGDHPVTVALNVGHPATSSAEDLVDKASRVAREGVPAIAYYNYGLLTRTRLEWVAQANEALMVGHRS